MTTNLQLRLIATIVAATFIATACGGGGGGSSSGTTTASGSTGSSSGDSSGGSTDGTTDGSTDGSTGGTTGGTTDGSTGGTTDGSTGGTTTTTTGYGCGSTGTASGTPSAVVAGAVTTPYPTINNIAVEWAYSGDTNASSTVSVEYRKQGDASWKTGMSLCNVPAGSTQSKSWSSRHSGSIFDLDAGTTYEIRLTLNDADGGGETRTVTATTRSVPTPWASAPVKNVTPATLAGTLSSAVAGDKIVLGAGTYSAFDINVSGQAGKPIVISGQAGATINGRINIAGRSHIYLEKLNVVGEIKFNGSSNISVVGCTIQASNSADQTRANGVYTYTRAENAYIADNVITGQTTWTNADVSVDGTHHGEGIVVTGPGHVIMNNRVSNFHDAISLMEDGEAVDQYSIDILNNDIRQAGDDGIEADFCKHNCRIMRNRLTNVFIAMSSQPGLGGPTYFIRNAAYNVLHVAFKLYRTSYGDVLLHNTIVKNGDGFGVYSGVPVYRAFIANNLFLGSASSASYNGYSGGTGKVIQFEYLNTASSSIDYQAYGTTASTFAGRIGATSFSNLAQLNSNTPEKHSVQTAISAFAAGIAYPSTAMTAYAPVDLRLQSGTEPVDKALPIANVSDSYNGTAPDIGAYEVGVAMPTYGPR